MPTDSSAASSCSALHLSSFFQYPNPKSSAKSMLGASGPKPSGGALGTMRPFLRRHCGSGEDGRLRKSLVADAVHRRNRGVAFSSRQRVRDEGPTGCMRPLGDPKCVIRRSELSDLAMAINVGDDGFACRRNAAWHRTIRLARRGAPGQHVHCCNYQISERTFRKCVSRHRVRRGSQESQLCATAYRLLMPGCRTVHSGQSHPRRRLFPHRIGRIESADSHREP